MDGETTSWIRRANFSHTVCYRMITTKSLESNTPFVVNKERTFGFERLPLTSPLDLKPLVVATLQQPMGLNVAERCVVGSEIQRNSVTNKKRSVSPSPHIPLPDSFKEAKSNIKRFSTPHPIRMEPAKGTKLSRKYSFEKISSNLWSLSHSTPIKERSKSSKKDKMSSLKSFDYGGSRVSSIGMGGLEEHLIDTSHVSYGDMFAQAIYSQLFLGEYKGKEVALKIIKANDDSEGDPFLGARLEKQFIKEATLLSRLSHPNVVKFVGVNSGNCIIMEYLPKGSLRSYLHKLERKSLPLQQLIKFGLDIARGMEYIHSREIVHRDLKPGNVLIDQNFGLKIADFGIACEEEYCCNSFGDNTGTFRWMAPEVIRRRPHGRKADVYSFGLVLWEMVAGAIPYEDLTPVQAAFAVVHKNIRPMIPNDCPVAIKDMIEQCWTVEADKRPEFWQIVKVLEQFEKSLKSEGKLVLSPSQICPELKKTTKHWIRIFGLANHHHHHHGGNNNTKKV